MKNKYILPSIFATIFFVCFASVNIFADNYKPGDGPSPKTFASDDVSSVQYPRVKIVHGLDGVASETTANNGLPVDASLPLSAFGELNVVNKTPQAQVRFPYNLVPADSGQILTNKSGSSVSVSNAQAVVTASSTAESYSQIRSVDTIRYGPGQGAEFLGTAIFSPCVANSSQYIGAGDDDEGFFFGCSGSSFGVLNRSFGSLEIKSITITGVADSGGGDLTITLDGTAVTVTVIANSTISQTVAKIVSMASTFLDAGRGWEVHTDDNVSVEFISLVAENAAGDFSFADVSSGVTAGAFSETVAGVAPTETFVAQADWNVDPMDGTGPSGQTLVQTFGNVYKITFQYLGYGAVEFCIENGETGKLQAVHIIKYANTAILPTLQDPTLHLTVIVKTDTGYSGSALVMKTSSLAGFIQGNESIYGLRRSASQTKTITTTETVLMIIHNELDFNGRKNKITVYPDYMSFGSESTKTTILRMYRNPTGITGGAALTDVDTNNSVMKTGQTGTAIIGGARIVTAVFNAGEDRNLGLLQLRLRPGERYVVTAQISSGAEAIVDISMTWVERI